MSQRTFRTEVEPSPLPFRIRLGSPILSIGSCFAETVAERLLDHRFPVSVNPSGILFNPASIAALLTRMLDGNSYSEDELFQNDGEWKCLSHHSRFSGPDRFSVIEKMNAAFNNGIHHLAVDGTLLVTFGSAFAYHDAASGTIVANCHKLPAKSFSREMLSIEEIVDQWSSILVRLHALYPEMRVIFTVSPVRHLRDDPTENSLSKAVLRCAVHSLCSRFLFAEYFPAFEIMMDDLRDYRFYCEDMIHPSPLAVDYIVDAFASSCLDSRARTFFGLYGKISNARRHEIRGSDDNAVAKFARAHLDYLETLHSEYPEIDLGMDISLFSNLLEPSR